MSVPFLGEDRHTIVDGLIADFDAVADRQGPRMVVLSGPSGWGKTRVVQEFYRRLAAERPGDGPSYWPDQIVNEATVGSVGKAEPLEVARKAVFPRPPFTVPARATMPWMWWGISCRERQVVGGAELTLSEARHQFGYHYAELSRGELSALAAALKILGWQVLNAATMGAAGFAKDVVDRRKELNGILTTLEHRRDRREGWFVAGDEPVSPDEELVASISHLSQRLPLVLVVDDAHDAEERVVHLAEGLLDRPSARVLIIATGWPGAVDTPDQQRRSFGDLVDRHLGPDAPDAPDATEDASASVMGDLVDRHLGPDATDAPGDASASVKKIKLKALSQDDARTLIVAELPEAKHVVDELIDRYTTNPHNLRAVLQLEGMRADASSGRLTTATIRGLPLTLRAIRQDEWHRIPSPVQSVLGLAAQVGQGSFVAQVIAAAAVGLVGEPASELGKAISTWVWTRKEVDESLHTFLGREHHEIAREAGHGLLGTHRVEHLHATIVEAACSPADSGLTPLARLTLADHHVSLARDASAPTVAQDAAAARSAHLVARAAAARYEYAAAISLARQALEWGDAEDLDVRHSLAYWLGESGQLPEAITQFTALRDDHTRILGLDHPDTLTTRNNLAASLGESGKHAEAITQYTALLNDHTRILGPDHPDTLRSRSNLASLLGQSGQHTQAITQFTALRDDRTRILGPDHPDTLATRNNLAYLLGNSGQFTEAITQFTALLNDRTRTLGPDHPGTLRSRHNLAYWLGESGQLPEAITQFTALLKDHTRILGPDHPDTLATRNNLAASLGESGKHAEAITQYTALLTDQTRILGPDHPGTLTTRSNLARFLGQSGQLTEAITQFTALLNDRTRILGPDHPDTLTTRHNLAHFLGQSGQLTEAITQYTALLTDRTRILGPDHPDTLRTRSNLASLLGQSGQHAEAITHFTALRDDQTRILGPDHPDTLITRNNLACWLGESGQLTEAITHFTALLTDQTRILGPDHPDTLITRSNLAVLHVLSGAISGAVEGFVGLEADCLRALGPKHPLTRSVSEVLDRLRDGGGGGG